MILKANADLIGAVGMAASADETRYYLAGVHIEPAPQGGILIVATDGHMLACAHDPQGVTNAPAQLLKLDFNSKELVSKKGKQRLLVVEKYDTFGTAAGRIEIDGMLEAPIKVERIDGTFPDWRRVVPDTSRPHDAPDCYGWNAKLIGRALKVFAKAGADTPEHMTFHHTARFDPALVTVDGLDSVFVVTMPLTSVGLSPAPDCFWSPRMEAAA